MNNEIKKVTIYNQTYQSQKNTPPTFKNTINNINNNNQVEYIELNSENLTNANNITSTNKELEKLIYNNASIIEGFKSGATILHNASCAGGTK